MEGPEARARPLPKYLAGSPGKGSDVVPYWDTTRTPSWSSITRRFSDTAWLEMPREAWDRSLRRIMAGAWWSVRATFLEADPRDPSHFCWRRRLDHALDRIERHDGFEQPWVKERAAKQATAQKKQNKKKKKSSDEGTVGSKRKTPSDGDEGEEDDEAEVYEGKSRRIRIFPTDEQKALIKRWIGTTRWTYNQCNAAIRKGVCEPTAKALRALFVKEEALRSPPAKVAKSDNAKKGRRSLEWVLETPCDVRDRAVAEIVQAYANATQKYGVGKFTIKFKQAKRMRQETLTLRGRDWGRNRGAYSSTFRADRLRATEPLPAVIQRDFKVIRTRLGQYYLSIPVDLDMRGENQAPVPRWVGGQGGEVVAIDPGVRTPFTCFDPQGYVYEIGNKDFGRIKRLCHHMDDLQSRFSQRDVRKKRRYRMKRAWLRMHRRVRNLVDDLHRKTVKWLCESYRVILYPHYETSNMVIRERRADDPYARALRSLTSKTARAMLTWSHYRFKQHLLHKIREYPWCRVVLVNEAYTSKTCSECGHIHRGRFRRYDTFQCGACNIMVDRDWNGARGIWLRFLTDWAGDPVTD